MKTIIYKSPKLPRTQEKFLPDDELGVLKKFEDTLKNTNFDLSIFYENCKSLEFIVDEHLEKTVLFKTDAEYNILFNQLSYNSDNYSLTIFHELFHMASNIVGHKVIYNGLSQIRPKEKIAIGFSIKEAYTCILDERHFGSKEKEDYYQGIYPISRSLVELLEDLLGASNMEIWYSQADLPEMIKELSKYFGKDPAIKFIDCLDKITYYNEYGDITNPFLSVICYRYALTFLGRCFIKKYILEYQVDKDDHKLQKSLKRVRKLMDKRIVYPVPFKIIKSRKYTNKEFMRDVKTIKKHLIQ